MHKPKPSPAIADQILALPQAGEGKRGETGHIAYLLRQAAAAVRLKMERALADIDVTPPQFAVLTMIAAYPGLSNADLARLAVLTPQTVSLIVANLEHAGLLSRSPHAVHGRIQHLEPTGTGLDRLAACKERVRTLETGLTAGLSTTDEGIVRRWLATLAVSP